mmetsp:Transcript_22466/g.55412  ORF Transcript_22466/g.55412 Transcript_22466/m.55412 type:complete len:273 (-) Transcript_22466:263-1081(-)
MQVDIHLACKGEARGLALCQWHFSARCHRPQAQGGEHFRRRCLPFPLQHLHLLFKVPHQHLRGLFPLDVRESRRRADDDRRRRWRLRRLRPCLRREHTRWDVSELHARRVRQPFEPAAQELLRHWCARRRVEGDVADAAARAQLLAQQRLVHEELGELVRRPVLVDDGHLPELAVLLELQPGVHQLLLQRSDDGQGLGRLRLLVLGRLCCQRRQEVGRHRAQLSQRRGRRRRCWVRRSCWRGGGRLVFLGCRLGSAVCAVGRRAAERCHRDA